MLAEVEAAGVDLILFGGDLVAGAFPVETLELIRSLGDRARLIRGNADRDLRDWPASRLPSDDQAFLAGLPEREVLEIDGLGRVLFCHSTPWSDEPIFTEASPDERVRELFAGVAERIVVCGHTHMQFDRMVDGIRIVNAGSVGMPYGEPGGHWAVLGPDVRFRRTDYDREAAAGRIRTSGWPEAEEFAAENVLTVPTRDEAIEYFESLAGSG